MARPTEYKSEYVEQSYKLTLLGATDKDLANFFEVTEQTINNWKKDYPEFFESIKRGKEVADANVAQSLYNRALGYSHPDTDIKVIQNQIVATDIIKHYPPDTTAAIFWLKNRKPDTWREKTEQKIEGELNIIFQEEKTYKKED